MEPRCEEDARHRQCIIIFVFTLIQVFTLLYMFYIASHAYHASLPKRDIALRLRVQLRALDLSCAARLAGRDWRTRGLPLSGNVR